jgi:hypothetical protein
MPMRPGCAGQTHHCWNGRSSGGRGIRRVKRDRTGRPDARRCRGAQEEAYASGTPTPPATLAAIQVGAILTSAGTLFTG